MTRVSRRAASLSHFLAMEVFERAAELEDVGADVVHLEFGEPDFPAVRAGAAAAHRAIDDGDTRYTHSLGVRELRERIAAALRADHGADVDPERVVVTMGSSAAILLAFAALLDPGDAVVVPDPGYPCYANIALALGAEPARVAVRPADGFSLDPDSVRRALGARTRAIVVNSPANPTGAVTSRATLESLAATGVTLVSDEIYHGLVYEGTATSVLELTDTAFVVGGFSKRYAMTGWRVGWLVVPPGAVRAVQALQQNLFISAGDVSQRAAAAAFSATDEAEAMRVEYDRRRRYLVAALDRIGLPVPVQPSGAFYVFADARAYTVDSMAFTMRMLRDARVAVAPGIDFGPNGEGWIRLSYATSMPHLEEAVERLGPFLEAARTVAADGGGGQIR